MGTIKIICGAVITLGVITCAVFLSHHWDPQSGIDPFYVVLALAVVSLAFPGPRQLLRRITKVNLGGVEVTLQIDDAVAATSTLPDVDEDDDRNSNQSLKIIGEDWRKEPRGALAKLQAKLDERLRWIEDEVYPGSVRSIEKTIDKLRGGVLIGPLEARIVETVKDLSPDVLRDDMNLGGETKEAAVRFVERADQIVHQLRLMVFDARVRREVGAGGLKILEILGQPRQRWPDFYIYDPKNAKKQPLRITVRLALSKNSDLIENNRKRLRNRRPETPVDLVAQSVITFPSISSTKPTPDDDIPALRYPDFLIRIKEYANLRPDSH